jgi:autotransporter-associated beta strand protein
LELVAGASTAVLALSGQIKPPAEQLSARQILVNGGGASAGSGTIVLENASNSYTGGTTITNGTLVLPADVPASGPSPIGTGSLIFADGATPEDGTVSLILDGPLSFARNSNISNNSSASGTRFTVLIGMSENATGNATWHGNITSNNDARLRILQLSAPAAAASIEFSGAITANPGSGVVRLEKTGAGTVILSGTNTYDGDTIVSAGTLELAEGGQITFILGTESGINTRISGEGTAIIDGNFLIDESAAADLASGAWTLEELTSLAGPYGSTFSVVGYTDTGDNKWKKNADGGRIWTFDETSGILTLETDASITPFETWISNYPSIPLDSRGPEADPDGDGKTNLEEFAFGTDPTDSASGPIRYVNGGSVTIPGAPDLRQAGAIFDAVFGRRTDYVAAGLSYTAQFSADLSSPWAVSLDEPTVLATDGEIDAVSVPFPGLIVTDKGPQKARFFRVGVSLAP